MTTEGADPTEPNRGDVPDLDDPDFAAKMAARARERAAERLRDQPGGSTPPPSTAPPTVTPPPATPLMTPPPTTPAALPSTGAPATPDAAPTPVSPAPPATPSPTEFVARAAAAPEAGPPTASGRPAWLEHEEARLAQPSEAGLRSPAAGSPTATPSSAANAAAPLVGAGVAAESTSTAARLSEQPRFADDEAVVADDETLDQFFGDTDERPDDGDAEAGELDAAGETNATDQWLRSAIEWAAVIVGALVVALIIKTFFFQAFYIPSESMEPTLERNDRILVNKLDDNPERGDLLVFERPPTSTARDVNELIKRVVGLPGETVTIRNGQVLIGDELLVEPYLGEGIRSGGSVWTASCANPQGDGASCTVPEGHLFMMGDNRGNSTDSRSFGPIDSELVVGRAVVLVWPPGKFGRL